MCEVDRDQDAQTWQAGRASKSIASSARRSALRGGCPVEEKLCAGGDLFDDVCERMRDGIRWQFPDADETQVEKILRERLDIARRLERLP